ncbi:hypothetical protein EV672_104184 [Aquabacterium commune]|uniref:Uncharacterized protein n=1 Tax=Aquabacterium commune TaxID=70586 RepID=A0A4R6RCB8_9BURK|nr:hypothetical protein [Aquabacterium commune]TDP83803.1 hypothetical protein EV672_104184 [Aquabacterium commune]
MTVSNIVHRIREQAKGAGFALKSTHTYELLASAFGQGTWASFTTRYWLTDSPDGPVDAVGERPETTHTLVAARALQLGLEPASAPQLGTLVLNAVQAARLGKVEKAAFDRLRLAGLRLPAGLPQSPLFISQLSAAASAGDAQAHHRLAAIYRCKRPNPYLYDESLKGRTLTAQETKWVDEYLGQAQHYPLYQAHLKAAAQGGVRAAALEYAEAFEDPSFFELADRLSGPVDAKRMAQAAPDASARHKWLRVAGQHDLESLEELASEGDVDAMQQLAIAGDAYHLRALAERALEDEKQIEAWAWQYIALAHGHDLTRSTLAARHDGGSHHGEFYDSDFGGPLFVDGEEGIELPQLPRRQMAEAKRLAKERMSAQSLD